MPRYGLAPTTLRTLSISTKLLQRKWGSSIGQRPNKSLLKSITLFDPQITAGEKSDSELHSQLSLNYRASQSQSYALLAVVYFREGRVQAALSTVEKAYDEVSKYKLALNSIIKS